MMEEAEYMALVDALEAASGKLSRLGAGIIAALALDIASDSRSFSRILGIAHALVLREVVVLSAEGGYIRIRQRDERTQRTRYELSATGHRLVEEMRL
ncbi:hypothetical protein CQ052_08225 [Ochrobactrum sp. MYb15]|nr:hypothetical protein [Brucella rhizosphaerae]PQZ51355.1 hypothetical protein CQZ90_00670 [Ochrobactrum sp. MYb19]PRA65611.1 hypothetical protein CQ053_11750 [Ochrobactrum sp. MYb18]PRA77301.1 hypothetical protein CQ049_08225 [Brucella thiophenivorans]PRA93064.1 hypothetical protein CQ051_00670 [Ochrobactrum sp. MYb14]PRA99311.1 hypothetical protein CQ052_08225 [Ochrobactrum sp. MYb15]